SSKSTMLPRKHGAVAESHHPTAALENNPPRTEQGGNEIEQARQARKEAQAAEALATQKIRNVVHDLRHNRGYSITDTAALLNIFPARVSQLKMPTTISSSKFEPIYQHMRSIDQPGRYPNTTLLNTHRPYPPLTCHL